MCGWLFQHQIAVICTEGEIGHVSLVQGLQILLPLPTTNFQAEISHPVKQTQGPLT